MTQQPVAASKNRQTLPFVEFVVLIALMTALVALSIDAMLPALGEIGQALGVQAGNDSQLIISLLFLGMAIGQLFYGPLSDSIGRKPAIYLGLGIFAAGCLLSLSAVSFRTMLIGRFLQGLGVAGPRSVVVAVVRDLYEGRAMARVMSFVMAVFILVPIIAPSIGQLVLLFFHWRAIFGLFLLLTLIMLLWFSTRQPETLPPNQRTPFTLQRIAAAFREVGSNRTALGYTLAAGFVAGAFIGYLNSAQQIFQNQYGLGSRFPLYFGGLAMATGLAALFNGRIVMHYGMRLLTTWAIIGMTGVSLLFFLLAFAADGSPRLWLLMGYFLLIFFAIGILFGNLNSLAMEPLGHIAGVGAAVVGAVSTLLSTLLGTLVGQAYDGTVLPLVGGFALLGFVAWGVMRWAEKSLFLPSA